jgi:predicted amidohydrolase
MKESLLKVAAIQFEPIIGQKERNVNKMIKLIEKAADQGAKLICLPEMANTGYVFASREEAYELAEPIPKGPTAKELEEIAKKRNVYIVSGICERDGINLFNAAVFIGPEGYIGKYRKNHLWDVDKVWAEPGDLGFPIFKTPYGRVGIMICYDGWFPETTRIYTLLGADIVCDPANWVDVPGMTIAEKTISAYVHMVMAHVNRIFLVCADRIGTERGTTFLGNSCICGPRGFIAGPASFNKEELLIAEVNLTDARRKQWSPFNHIILDRRTDLYDALLGYKVGKLHAW